MTSKTATVNWRTEYDQALEQAADEQKPVLLFFYKDGCRGCAKMEAVTFPDLNVAHLLNEHFVSTKLDLLEQGRLAHKYHAIWTPNFRILDTEGDTIYQNVGWLPPSEFAPLLLLARGHFQFDRKRYEDAASIFAMLLDRYPRSGVMPECRFYLAISRYMVSDDHDKLEETWDAFYTAYPDNLWALRTRIDQEGD
jgi:thioredoxin-related protein